MGDRFSLYERAVGIADRTKFEEQKIQQQAVNQRDVARHRAELERNAREVTELARTRENRMQAEYDTKLVKEINAEKAATRKAINSGKLITDLSKIDHLSPDAHQKYIDLNNKYEVQDGGVDNATVHAAREDVSKRIYHQQEHIQKWQEENSREYPVGENGRYDSQQAGVLSSQRTLPVVIDASGQPVKITGGTVKTPGMTAQFETPDKASKGKPPHQMTVQEVTKARTDAGIQAILMAGVAGVKNKDNKGDPYAWADALNKKKPTDYSPEEKAFMDNYNVAYRGVHPDTLLPKSADAAPSPAPVDDGTSGDAQSSNTNYVPWNQETHDNAWDAAEKGVPMETIYKKLTDAGHSPSEYGVSLPGE